MPCPDSLFTPPNAFVGPEAICCAIARASSITAAGGTTLLTKPQACASTAVKTRFVSISSFARSNPTCFAR